MLPYCILCPLYAETANHTDGKQNKGVIQFFNLAILICLLTMDENDHKLILLVSAYSIILFIEGTILEEEF